jgi:hypothetical protein
MTEKFVYAVLIVVFVTYARFVVLVVSDITNYLGIACLTVRKRDVNGVWRSAVGMKASEKWCPLDYIRFAAYIDWYTGIAHHVKAILTLPIPLQKRK